MGSELLWLGAVRASRARTCVNRVIVSSATKDRRIKCFVLPKLCGHRFLSTVGPNLDDHRYLSTGVPTSGPWRSRVTEPLTESYLSVGSQEPLLDLTVGQVIDRAAQLYGDREAVVSVHQQLSKTFTQLHEDVSTYRLCVGYSVVS